MGPGGKKGDRGKKKTLILTSWDIPICWIIQKGEREIIGGEDQRRCIPLRSKRRKKQIQTSSVLCGQKRMKQKKSLGINEKKNTLYPES